MSMSPKELEAEINRLTRAKQEAERELAEQKRHALMAAGNAFVRAKGVHVSLSDDYAVLTVDNYGTIDRSPSELEFYYGYEKTVCLTHGPDCKDWCDDSEWAFVVTDSGQEVMRLGESQLHPEARGVAENLLGGIGLWISAKRKEKAPPVIETERSTPPEEES